MNRSQRAQVIRAQFIVAERKGELHECPECAAAFLWASLVDHMDRQGPDRETLAAVELLERPAAPGVH
jgi:hypothetical protein